jgi:hypothetical protein
MRVSGPRSPPDVARGRRRAHDRRTPCRGGRHGSCRSRPGRGRHCACGVRRRRRGRVDDQDVRPAGSDQQRRLGGEGELAGILDTSDGDIEVDPTVLAVPDSMPEVDGVVHGDVVLERVVAGTSVHSSGVAGIVVVGPAQPERVLAMTAAQVIGEGRRDGVRPRSALDLSALLGPRGDQVVPAAPFDEGLATGTGVEVVGTVGSDHGLDEGSALVVLEALEGVAPVSGDGAGRDVEDRFRVRRDAARGVREVGLVREDLELEPVGAVATDEAVVAPVIEHRVVARPGVDRVVVTCRRAARREVELVPGDDVVARGPVDRDPWGRCRRDDDGGRLAFAGLAGGVGGSRPTGPGKRSTARRR